MNINKQLYITLGRYSDLHGGTMNTSKENSLSSAQNRRKDSLNTKQGWWVEFSWVYLTADGQSITSSWYRAHLWGPMTRFYPYHFFSDNCFVVLPVGRPLWREDGSVTYSAIAVWSGDWGPIPYITVSFETVFPLRRLLRLAGTMVKVFLPASTRVKGDNAVSKWDCFSEYLNGFRQL
jgi:hypothetical protein